MCECGFVIVITDEIIDWGWSRYGVTLIMDCGAEDDC